MIQTSACPRILSLTCAALALTMSARPALAQGVPACGGPLFQDSKLATGLRPIAVRLANLDGSGALDLVSANFGGSSVSVLLSAGNGVFAPQVTYATTNAPFINGSCHI